MAQYHKLKAQYAGFLLLFRIGDFYEMFYDDAIRAAQILDITVSDSLQRAKHFVAAISSLYLKTAKPKPILNTFVLFCIL